MSGSIALRHIAFTGTGVPDAELSFEDGLNIVFGASNTGKSFTMKALNFMLGSSKPLAKIDERAPYESVWLGLRLENGSEVTLTRSVKGYGFTLFPGLVTDHVGNGIALDDKHNPKSHANLSMYLLNLIGLDDKVVVRNSSGEKDSLSFRHLAPYLFTGETVILEERSPIMASGQYTAETLEKNVFRLLLTGLDDRHVQAVMPKKTQTAVRAGKIELVDEWIARIDRELGETPPTRRELGEQSDRLEGSVAELEADLSGAQERLDQLLHDRREARDSLAALVARVADLDLTIDSFTRLDEVYVSDIDRLEALEEGGALLLAIGGRDCPTCGAPPEAQAITHQSDEIGRAHAAATAEILKIRRDRVDLASVLRSLSAEAHGLRSVIAGRQVELQGLDADIAEARPAERGFRERYEGLGAARSRIARFLDLYARRDRLTVERAQLDVSTKAKATNEGNAVGIDGPTAFAYARVVQEILHAWKFPDSPQASFDRELQDISLDGKDRSANGKGVRAIIHAAMKVAVLIYCHRRELPHPGFVVLDSPLLAYRGPLDTIYGPRAPDEEVLVESDIASNFYAHLASLSDIGQFVILENAIVPPQVRPLANYQAFSRSKTVGRYGFFPVR